MKIVVDARWIKQTGIGRYLEKTLEQILKIDQQNQYILLIRSQDLAQIKLKANNLKLVFADHSWYGIAEQTKLVRLIHNLKPDLVHFANFNVPLSYNGKFVVTIHDLTLLNFKNIKGKKFLPLIYRFKDWIMRRVLSHAVKKSLIILTPSEFVKNQIIKRYEISPAKIMVTYEAAEPEHQKITNVNLNKFNITRPFILYVGNAYPHKNLQRLILAFQLLLDKYLCDLQLVIVGKKDTFHYQLEQEVRSANLSDRVIFTGFVSDDELDSLYRKAKIYTFPSLSEGFGLPALEAIGHNLPVASSKATCLPEVLGEAALYYNPLDIEEMAKVMYRLITDSNLRQKLIKAGQKQFKKFSWEKTAKKTLNAYQQALR